VEDAQGKRDVAALPAEFAISGRVYAQCHSCPTHEKQSA